VNYQHTQKSPLHRILIGVALACVLVIVTIPEQHKEPISVSVFLGLSVVTMVLAFCFKTLTVEDGGDHLQVSFGPLPFFRKRIPYSQISDISRGRSSFLDGWGIHYMPGRGWIWNLWGYDCVEMRLNESRFRIGTDDPDELVAFLKKATHTTIKEKP
jgi:hypothetical protein